MSSKRPLILSPESDNSHSNIEQSSKKSNISEVVLVIRDILVSEDAKDIFRNLFAEIVAPIKQDLLDLQTANTKLTSSLGLLQDRVDEMEEQQDMASQDLKRGTIIIINQWQEKRAEVPFLILNS